MEPIKSSICRSCRLRIAGQTKARSFSTSSVKRIVPPESPYFVDIPSSHQPYLPWIPKQKGVLPVPRELFPASRPDKPSDEYLTNVTKEPLEKNKIPEQNLTGVGKYKAKMAEIRRSQLREGLTALHARKQAEIRTMAHRSHAKQLQRDELLKQAEREDARLTNVSTLKEMHPDSHNSIEALKAEVDVAKRMYAEKVANYERVQAEKQESKMDSLHTLYMNARHFITTEDQLSQLINEQFDPRGPNDEYSRHADFQTTERPGTSMWNFGPPDGIKKMIADSTNKPHVGDPFARAVSRVGGEEVTKMARFRKEQERMKKIAEKLSGGKI